MRIRRLAAIALLSTLLAACAVAHAATEIRVWHAVGGWPGVTLEQLVAAFNASQREYRFVAGYSGEAPAAARDARRRGAALLALPYNPGTVLYYNRDAFRRANLDPAAPPKTWYDMAPAIGALLAAGQRCGYTTAQPAAILLESAGAWPAETRLGFDNVMLRWVAMLASWHKSGYFVYAAREEDAERRFAAGECALLTAPPSRQADLRARIKFDLAVAPLPQYEDFGGARQEAVGLWLMPGRPEAEYRGVSRLLAFLATPEAQALWREKTGGARLAPATYNLPVLRGIFDEELGAAWVGKKTPLEALTAAVARGNGFINKSLQSDVHRAPATRVFPAAAQLTGGSK
jgi:ABC-type glycerol-3-phosphate transport system substrate-binding protein